VPIIRRIGKGVKKSMIQPAGAPLYAREANHQYQSIPPKKRVTAKTQPKRIGFLAVIAPFSMIPSNDYAPD
jgi:hypothetical protein